MKKKIALIGYGVIGKRVADAIARQDDMELAGVCDVISDWRIQAAVNKGYPVYAATKDASRKMEQAGITMAGNMGDLLDVADLAVDCTPKKIAAHNVDIYKERGIKYILQGGEKHETTGHSFSAETIAMVLFPITQSKRDIWTWGVPGAICTKWPFGRTC